MTTSRGQGYVCSSKQALWESAHNCEYFIQQVWHRYEGTAHARRTMLLCLNSSDATYMREPFCERMIALLYDYHKTITNHATGVLIYKYVLVNLLWSNQIHVKTTRTV